LLVLPYIVDVVEPRSEPDRAPPLRILRRISGSADHGAIANAEIQGATSASERSRILTPVFW